MDLKIAWEKFRKGDGLTDLELDALICDCKLGCAFLQNRDETGGVLLKALLDMETLRGYRNARVLPFPNWPPKKST